MRALVYDGDLRVCEVPAPQPGKGEALVRVLTAGICNTDIELTHGYMGFRGIPGHEFVGVVEQASNAQLTGRRVVGEINCACHTCRHCQLEMPHHCLDRTVLGILRRDGAFADYLTLPEENLHLVPNAMRDDVAVFAEPVAAAFRILEQIRVGNEDRIIVLGDGKLGQLIAQTLWLHSKNLVCVGKHAQKLALLERLRIATASFNDPIEAGADIVVEATGSRDGIERALELVRPEGVIVLKTTVAGVSDIDFSKSVINEVKIIGSRCGPFRPALEALALGNVEVRHLVTETFSLDDALAAFERASQRDAMKVLLRME
ncbi:MAG TPA: alcohol dehydrogenase catalytic domain-containing protein [Candidatus Hydrogenedentes bacterium]|nr:alcohol dehydrogenase catalytic domain-containing protein [Candidatus Hydrogenedentota bacterium]HOS04034.1 alcohol dehydrogenase catalytic domain-containing protein [Candidatus Hydrogenedentota bacterium]